MQQEADKKKMLEQIRLNRRFSSNTTLPQDENSSSVGSERLSLNLPEVDVAEQNKTHLDLPCGTEGEKSYKKKRLSQRLVRRHSRLDGGQLDRKE